MKRLMALLLAALVLLFAPVSFVRAEEDEPAAAPPAAESEAGEQTSPAVEEQTPPAADADAEEEADPDEGSDIPQDPAEDADLDGEGASEETPADEPAADGEEPADGTAADGEEPADEPAADEEEPADGEEEEPEEAPHDQPQWAKSLDCWEQEWADIPLTGDIREDILTIARSQLGYSADPTCYVEDEEGFKRFYTRYGAWEGATFGDWCDSFVSFCIHYAGLEDYPTESSCIRHMFALKKAGYWREWNSYIPQKGDIVFFSFSEQYPIPCHVGLVEEVIWGEGDEPSRLITIEGNMGNPDGSTACVRRVVRLLSDVMGYGTYEVGTVYPEGYSYRTDGWWIIGPDSIYFLEYPVEEVLRFLGLEHSEYYTYWFPDEPMAEPTEPVQELLPKAKPRKAERSGMTLGAEDIP